MVNLNDSDAIKRILAFIEKNQDRILKDEKVFSMLEENIKPHVVQKLANELISERAFKISCERIPPINIFKLVEKRLSKIYSDMPLRTAEKGNDSSDQKAIKVYEEKAKINKKLSASNYMTNAQRRSALELYVDKKKPKIRVIPAHQFLVYSEDQINPMNVEVFIKFMGTINKTKFTDQNEAYNLDVPLYYLYTDKQFLIIDADGTVQFDISRGLGLKVNESGVSENPYGYIPFIYVNTSEYQLLPASNTDDVEFTLLILTLLTDLNYAVKYQAHSMIYTINIESESIDMNPDAIIDFKSDGEEGEKSEVGSIKPEIDIQGTLSLLASTLKLYLETKGLRVDVNSSVTSDKAESGIQETIKNATLIEERKEQVNLFQEVEEELWRQIADRHNRWRNSNKLDKKFKDISFSDDFDLKVYFPEQKPILSRRDKGLMLETEVNAALTSREKAIRELHPELTEPELKAEIQEIEKDKEKQLSVDTQIKNNEHNRKLANEKKSKDAVNVNSTVQDENPNKR